MARTTNKAARRAARALILQILYEIDVAQHEPSTTLTNHLAQAQLEDSERFIREMVLGVAGRQSELDHYIQEVAPEWPIEQMAPVDRNILRMAIFELLHRSDTPLKVAINEAVELARQYGSDSSRRFVNGALGTFAARYLDRS